MSEQNRGASRRRSREETDFDWLSWISVEAYKTSKSWSVYEWALSLHARKRLLDSDDLSDSERVLQLVREEPLNIGFYSPLIFTRAPVQDMTHVDILGQAKIYAMPGLRSAVEEWNLSGSDSRARVLKALMSSGPSIHGVSAHEFIARAAAESSIWPEPLAEDFSRLLSVAYLGVDLRNSDAALIAAFKTWLSSRRALLGEAGTTELLPPQRSNKASRRRPALKLTRGAQSRWATHHVLPYIDILIYAKYAGRQRPTAEAIGRKLFAFRPDSATAVVRQEVVPLVKILLDDEAIRRMILEGQANRVNEA